MHHIATKVRFLEDVLVECTFNDGKIYQYDMSQMFKKYPQLEELRRNRVLFESGQCWGVCIYWNDDLDFDCTDIYEDGVFVGEVEVPLAKKFGVLLEGLREDASMTQKELAKLSGINQADISRILDGKGNPTLKKIEMLLNALGKKIEISAK